jgi:hypothetical protein
MKRLLTFALGLALLPVSLNTVLAAEAPPPGQVDFGSFTPPKDGGQFVEVNLSSSLIGMAAKLVEKQEPQVAELLKGLEGVRVNVIGVNDDNRADLEARIEKIRKELDLKGWERVVKVQEQKQDVGVYLKTEKKDTVQGLVVVVKDGDKQAVFVNIVGNIRPEQISMLGERFDIDPLKEIGHRTGK